VGKDSHDLDDVERGLQPGFLCRYVRVIFHV
jgi:hypothetical protein